MFLTFNEAEQKISDGKLIHIAGAEELLKKLPKGNWIGGSTEYFMTKDGGKVSGDMLFVTEFDNSDFNIKTYDTDSIKNVAADAYDNGFSIVIVPFDSKIHKDYAENAADYENMFMSNIVGWVAGVNLGVSGQVPIAVNGLLGEVYTDKASVLHLGVAADKTVAVNIINIFEQDDASALVEFAEEGFIIKNCLINGKETVLADYIKENNIDIKMPLVGNYSGTGINVSFKAIENDTVYLYAPVFKGIEYRIAKTTSDYEEAFLKQLSGISDSNTAFSCNCILNFLYGGLEGKNLDAFAGPITFGEIAYQLVNQTLVYVDVID
jgi:hypothetical protein